MASIDGGGCRARRGAHWRRFALLSLHPKFSFLSGSHTSADFLALIPIACTHVFSSKMGIERAVLKHTSRVATEMTRREGPAPFFHILEPFSAVFAFPFFRFGPSIS